MAPVGNAQNGRQIYTRYGCYQRPVPAVPGSIPLLNQ